MPPKDIHEDFIETLGKESPSYSTVENRATEFKRERASRMMEGLVAPKMSRYQGRSHTWLCVIGGNRCVASEAGFSFGAVQ